MIADFKRDIIGLDLINGAALYPFNTDHVLKAHTQIHGGRSPIKKNSLIPLCASQGCFADSAPLLQKRLYSKPIIVFPDPKLHSIISIHVGISIKQKTAIDKSVSDSWSLLFI